MTSVLVPRQPDFRLLIRLNGPFFFRFLGASGTASPVICPTIFSIFRISAYCLSSRLTSSTDVPLPRAMRLRRLPSITSACSRSSGVIELMIASTRRSCRLVGLGVAERLQLAHARQQLHDVLERAHLADGPQLIAEVAER